MERSVRCLLAWMSEAEAINNLLGHIPAPGEDSGPQRTIWASASDAKDGRDAYQMPTPTLADVPAELAERNAAFAQRPDVVAAFQGMDWRIGVADLSQVLSFQKVVVEEQALERVDAGVDVHDLASIFSFCLPDPAGETNLPGALDHDQKGITFSSSNPNLRIGGQVVVPIDIAPAPGQPPSRQNFVGFIVTFGAQFVQVAEYNGRWFVRDGYHRCYGLLRRGVTQIPCVFVRARTFEELGAAQPGFFPYEVLFGDRPPFVKDFMDDSVSATTRQLAHRKVVRIRGEEFIVAV
jgi:hypothetical protein